ncbi:Cas10/Cmr2 second palm domain-containing protein [Puniceibacterium sediminis]|uniref:Cas10/Cmr2 second palm domain-containing protein n=1 Tax=Puniceibacterium sediminis TaxID=1608407 RepID=A0A238WDS5_9RHOB|nr:hypothetical protein [Puniceibacterium sediminis]SNR44588.1 hypothetical protein SAMN06265370_105129 [Puniceibacterium sediminis]
MMIQFEAKSIQEWISSGNKLNDISGGSEILEVLVSSQPQAGGDESLLMQCLRQSEVAGNLVVNAASRIQIECEQEEEAKCIAFCRLWVLVLRSIAPDLKYDLDIRTIAFDEHGDEIITVHRDFGGQGALPMIGPMVQRSPLTGRPAVAAVPVSSGRADTSEKEVVDQATFARRLYGRRTRKDAKTGNTKANEKNVTLLLQKIIPDSGEDTLVLMSDTEELSERAGRRSLAYVHADASGLGAVYGALNVSKASKSEVKRFSEGLDHLTQESVRFAVGKCVALFQGSSGEKPLPIRPILVGGDDVTVILPATLGYAFAVAFMSQFKSRSRVLMAETKQRVGLETLPDSINVGCGIAFVGPHYPARNALELADSLCSFSKVSVGRTTSALAFHRVKGAANASDYKSILKDELTVSVGGLRFSTNGPYLLSAPQTESDLQFGGKGMAADRSSETLGMLNGFMTVDQLSDLVITLAHPEFPNGPMRKVLDLVDQLPSDGDARLKRIFEVSDGSDAPKVRDLAKDLKQQLSPSQTNGKGVSIWRPRGRIYSKQGTYKIGADTPLSTPLSDANTLISVSHRPGKTAQPMIIKTDEVS